MKLVNTLHRYFYFTLIWRLFINGIKKACKYSKHIYSIHYTQPQKYGYGWSVTLFAVTLNFNFVEVDFYPHSIVGFDMSWTGTGL